MQNENLIFVVMTVPERMQYALRLHHSLTTLGLYADIDCEEPSKVNVDAPDWWLASYGYVNHIWSILQRYPNQDVLIFEDDVQLCDDFANRLPSFLSAKDMPLHDVLILGYGKSESFGFGISDHLCRVKNVIGTYITLWRCGTYRNLLKQYLSNDESLRLKEQIDHEPATELKHIDKTRGIDRVLGEWANGFGLLRLYVAKQNFVSGFVVTDSVMDLSLGNGLDTSDIQSRIDYDGTGFEPNTYLYWKVPVDHLSNNTLYFNKLDVPITSNCNLRCDTCCHLNHVRNNRPDPPLKELLDSVENWFAKGLRPEMVGIVGGEPFLRDDLGSIVTGVRKTIGDRCLLIFTNGVLLQKKLADRNLLNILRAANTLIMVSLHTAEQIAHRQKLEAFLKQTGLPYVIKQETYLAPIYQIGTAVCNLENIHVVKTEINDPLLAYRASGRRSKVPSYHCLTRNCRMITGDELYRCSWTGHRMLAYRHGLLPKEEHKLLLEHRPAKLTDDLEFIKEYLTCEEDIDCCYCPMTRIRKNVEQVNITLPENV